MQEGGRRLLEELEEIRRNPHVMGPQHPRFKQWIRGVRRVLGAREGMEALARFERLRIAGVGREMWRGEELGPEGARRLRSELDEVAALLSAAEGAAARRPEAAIPEETLSPRREAGAPDPEDAPADATEENAVTRKNEGIDSTSAAPAGHFKAMEVLLADLGDELKRPDGDLNKIRKMMDDLVGLKRTGDLADRLLSAAAEPAARWDTVRELLGQLWAFNREVVLDLLPVLLKRL